MKRVTAIIVCVVMIMSINFTVYGMSQKINNEPSIDEDVAIAIAAKFVVTNIKEGLWSDSVKISDIKSMYIEEEVSAYYVELIDKDSYAGYLVVSADLKNPLIFEFSPEAELLVNDENVEKKSIRGLVDNERVYYYGPNCCSIDCLEYKSEKAYEIDEKLYYENTQFVSSIINDIVKPLAFTPNYITNPINYILSVNPGSTESDIYTVSNNSITGTIYNLIPNSGCYNGCSVCGTASIITYYYGLGTGYYSTILSNCMQIARTYGYATYQSGYDYWDYEIYLGDLEPFAQLCVNYHGISKTVDSQLTFSWLNAQTEINNNRPFLLNIATSDQYQNHTVVATGYCSYLLGSNPEYKFYKVRDGYINADRYVYQNSIIGDFITTFH